MTPPPYSDGFHYSFKSSHSTYETLVKWNFDDPFFKNFIFMNTNMRQFNLSAMLINFLYFSVNTFDFLRKGSLLDLFLLLWPSLFLSNYLHKVNILEYPIVYPLNILTYLGRLFLLCNDSNFFAVSIVQEKNAIGLKNLISANV